MTSPTAGPATPAGAPPGSTASSTAPAPDLAEASTDELVTRLSSQVSELVRGEFTEQVQAQEVLSAKAPAVGTAVRHRPALAGGIALALSYLLLSRLQRRKQRRARTSGKDVDGTR